MLRNASTSNTTLSQSHGQNPEYLCTWNITADEDVEFLSRSVHPPAWLSARDLPLTHILHFIQTHTDSLPSPFSERGQVFRRVLQDKIKEEILSVSSFTSTLASSSSSTESRLDLDALTPWMFTFAFPVEYDSDDETTYLPAGIRKKVISNTNTTNAQNTSTTKSSYNAQINTTYESDIFGYPNEDDTDMTYPEDTDPKPTSATPRRRTNNVTNTSTYSLDRNSSYNSLPDYTPTTSSKRKSTMDLSTMSPSSNNSFYATTPSSASKKVKSRSVEKNVDYNATKNQFRFRIKHRGDRISGPWRDSVAEARIDLDKWKIAHGKEDM